MEMEWIFWLLGVLTSPHLAIAWHELAHALAAICLGWSISRIQIGGGKKIQVRPGIYIGIRPLYGGIIVDDNVRNYPRSVAIIVAAGPIANLLLCIWAFIDGSYILAVVSLYVCCYAMLGSDGKMLRKSLRGERIPEES